MRQGLNAYRLCRILVVAFAAVTMSIARTAAQTTRPAEVPLQPQAAPATRPTNTTSPSDGTSASQPTDDRDEPTFNLWTARQLSGDWFGLRDGLEDIGIDFSLTYQHQLQGNLRGGLDTSNAWRQTGSYDAVLELDFGKMRLLDDAGFYFKAKGTWSESDFVGINSDKVGASGAARVNSDAADDLPIYVNKWWFWKQFLDKKVELRLGLIETVKDLYDVSLYANHEDKDFLNRLSFRNATIPHRTGMGAHLRVTPVEWLYFQTGGFDPHHRRTRTGFDTGFHSPGWFVGMWEMGLTPKWASPKGPMPGRYRAGFWYDPEVRTVYEDTPDGREPRTRSGNVGLYFGIDQMLWKENDDPADSQGLGLYTRYGHAPRDLYKISDYWSAGASYRGLIPTRDKDVTAFGVSQAILSSRYCRYKDARADRETVYEWYYKFYVTPWLAVSPDVQVITNPGGGKDARDALVAGVRFRVTF